MKKRAFKKDFIRSITHSWSRFWAIFAIVALGAGFFAGLRATSSDMQATGDMYYDGQCIMDIELLSTLGFTDDDVAAVAQAEGVNSVMATHRADVISSLDGEDFVIRIHGLPADQNTDNDNYINRPALTSGRMPENAGECVIGTNRLFSDTLQLGSSVTLQDDDGTLGDTLRYSRYTIVGLVDSAYYISYSLGSTTIGNGTISYFMYVPDSDFTPDVYTDLNITVEGAAALSSFSDTYETLVDQSTGALETLADAREQIRYDELYSEGQETLNDAQREYDDAKQEADQKLTDAKAELDDAQAKIDDGTQQLKDAADQISSSERRLSRAAATIAQNESQLEASQQEYDAGAAALADGWAAYDAGVLELNTQTQQWQQAYDTVTQSLIALDAAEAAAAGDPVLLADIAVQRQALLATQTQLDAQKDVLNASQQQLDATQAQLAQNEQQLDASKQQLDAGWAQLADAKHALADGRAKLAAAKDDYADGAAELEQSKADLADGWAEYEQSKSDAETKLADAQANIDDGYKQLADLKLPEWYILDRSDNVGFASFKADTGRMDSLSSVFPVLFFLVAALVALTTMTRMVEEERLIIGTYKALGYGKLRIASKYILYALLASVLGSAVGVLIGFSVLPVVCWNAYRLMYKAPDLLNLFNVPYALTGSLAAIFCTLTATVSACYSTLSESPASLMLPRAPKPGRRIFLESIPIIWKRLSFTRKVTCRNLFRYKKRLIMTIVGIAGCTALLLTGFALKDSISNIIHYQFGTIDQYNVMIGLEDDGLSGATQQILDEDSSGWLEAAYKSADIYSADGTRSQWGYLYIPKDASRLKDFITLRQRVSQDDIPFSEGSVVITEKLAKTLGVSSGDAILLKNADDEQVSFTVTGVTENYVYHYVYIDPALFKTKMGEETSFNAVIAVFDDSSQAVRDGTTDRLLDSGGVRTVMFTKDISERFGTLIKSLNYVVLVLIICAGALAFVVLYNLTNINITERQRELATIKVLGFFDSEVSSYIYRETTLLTIIGCILGLGFGVFMHAFVITTIEVDNVMFGRDIAVLSFVWSALLTLAFSAAVDLIMYRKLKKISMVDNLKSVD